MPQTYGQVEGIVEDLIFDGQTEANLMYVKGHDTLQCIYTIHNRIHGIQLLY